MANRGRPSTWTDAEIKTVSQMYPKKPNAEIGDKVGRTADQVGQLAARLGFKKDPSYKPIRTRQA